MKRSRKSKHSCTPPSDVRIRIVHYSSISKGRMPEWQCGGCKTTWVGSPHFDKDVYGYFVTYLWKVKRRMNMETKETESIVKTKVRMYHHSNHSLEPMEDCSSLGCRVMTGRVPGGR